METGISTSVLSGANVAKAMPRRPDLDTEQNSLGQDDLRELAGYVSLENAPVEHHDGGVREHAHGLPKNLETSPLSMPKHAGKPYSSSQRPGRPGRVRTGR
jgi:hypothetical protein